jgi:hypothetical protein
MSNFLIKLGYDAVAYNFMATPPLDKKHRCGNHRRLCASGRAEILAFAATDV